jgi:hypothetical protein
MDRHCAFFETARAGRLTNTISSHTRLLTSPSSMFMRLTSTGHSVILGALALLLTLHDAPLASFAVGDEPASESLPDWAKIADAHQETLSHVDSDQGAREVFVGAVGRAAALPDVAGALAVQGISTRLAKELMVPQITTSAQRLVSALVAWRLADRMMQSLESKAARAEIVVAPSQVAWLTANGPFPSLNDAIKLWDAGDTSAAVGVAVGHLAQEASRQAME